MRDLRAHKDTLLYKGIPHQIEIKIKKSVDITEPRIIVQDDSIIFQVTDKQNPNTFLKKWMTAETKDLINKTLEKYSDQMIKTPTRISVTDTKRWGYVRKNGSIIINWQLSALPLDLAEFIVLHEIVHLSHLNHQRGFHRSMIRIIPDYKQREKELKRYMAIEPNFEYKI